MFRIQGNILSKIKDKIVESVPLLYILEHEQYLTDQSYVAETKKSLNVDYHKDLGEPVLFVYLHGRVGDGLHLSSLRRHLLSKAREQHIQISHATLYVVSPWLGSVLAWHFQNHIQGWMNDFNMLLLCFREKMPAQRYLIETLSERRLPSARLERTKSGLKQRSQVVCVITTSHYVLPCRVQSIWNILNDG